MLLNIKNENIIITDNTQELKDNHKFLITKQNEKYIQNISLVKNQIITPEEVKNILDIENKIKIIGITGTNGKTTTAAAIYSILLDLGKKVAMQGTRGFFINEERYEDKSLTTPPILSILANLQNAIENNCEFFVMEVSSHAIEQNRIDSLPFYLKVFTNISQDHLDYHNTMEEYINVKSSFFNGECLKLINKDDKYIKYNVKNCFTYGMEVPATYKVSAYSLNRGIDCIFQKIDKAYNFTSSLEGIFNIQNLLCAIASVDLLGIESLGNICDVVENFGGVEGRMQVVNDFPKVIVDFAHTPDGIDKVLKSLSSKDLIVVFGAGGDRDKTKRAQMGRVVSRYAKKIIVTSDNPRNENPKVIIDNILSGINKDDFLFVEEDRKKAIYQALNLQCENEMVLILGKGDETYQEIKGKKYPFDDREIVKEFFDKNI